MARHEKVYFDDSLPALVHAIVQELGERVLRDGLVVRDSSGRLLFFSPEQSPENGLRIATEVKVASHLGKYARPDGVIRYMDEPGVEQLLQDPLALPLRYESYGFRLLDRRIVGSAWIDSPIGLESQPPRVVFSSLKGGVGRSTALALTASDLARRNQNVLIFDLDLEAPGVGGMLLDEERLPRFGAVDFLVENGLGGIDDHDLDDFLGTSTLTNSTGGRVDVVPAVGRSADQFPENVLPKLSRAMIEDIDSAGRSIALSAQMAAMVARFTERDSYSVVLIDSRAGLSELSAPAILGLGATVLFFGTAQRQTIQGYKALFAGLRLLAIRGKEENSSSEWRLRLKSVLAKSGMNEKKHQWYRDEMFDVFADNLYDAEEDQFADTDAITFGIDDPDAPHWPLIIPFDQKFIDFDPARTPGQLEKAFYETTYRPFLDGVDWLIGQATITDNRTESPS